jgi:LacI family transcriptional regulator
VAKNPTVYDVAERAGVSIATVSFTFRRPERVKESTREVVLTAARDLGYLPSANARGLANGRTGALALFSFTYLADAHANPLSPSAELQSAGQPGVDSNADLRLFPLYMDEVQRGVELECWRRGYAVMVGGGSHATSEAVVADIAGRVDGLAVLPRSIPEPVLRRITSRIPVVQLSQPPHGEGGDHVTVDNESGMRALTEHLITDHGLRDLLFVGGLYASDIASRFKGFRAALRAAGLRVPSKPVSDDGADWEAEAATRVRELLTRGVLPEAFVCATDPVALAVIDVLQAAGIRVPEQVAVTGFDGIAAGRIARPALTTVRQPMQELGRAAVDILIHRIGHPDGEPVSRQFPVSVVLRESCGCPPR